MRYHQLMLLAVVLLTATGGRAYADVVTFDLEWSPEYGTATATGYITIDTDDLPNPGAINSPNTMPTWVKDIQMTVENSAVRNGTYVFSDFRGISWDTEGGTLDLTKELVGQPTSWRPWGSSSTFDSGDFSLWTINPDVPEAYEPFQMLQFNSTATEILMLTKFTPQHVPEPTSIALFGIGAAGLSIARCIRRKNAI